MQWLHAPCASPLRGAGCLPVKVARVEIFWVCRWERFNVIPAIDLIRSKHSGQRQWCLWATISKHVTENQIILLPLWHEAGGLSKQKGIKMDQRCVHRSHKIIEVDRSACTAMPSFAASSASSYLSKSNNAFRENDSLYPLIEECKKKQKYSSCVHIPSLLLAQKSSP